MLRRLVLLSVPLAGLAGCAQYYWSRPGTAAEEFYRDSQDCARQASAATVTDVSIGLDQLRYRACLRDRHYTRQKQFVPPPPGWYRGIE